MSASISGDLLAATIDVPDLQADLLDLLGQLPSGSVTTYGELARALGDVRAARWVGEFLADHVHGDDCSCHRVVRANGDVGLYVSGDPDEKIDRLQSEGTTVRDGRADLSRVRRAEQFSTTAPLARLKRFLDDVAGRVSERRLPGPCQYLCGLDVAYTSDGLASGAAVILDASSLETIEQHTCLVPAPFPYIPGYLTFRELPVLQTLWDRLVMTSAGSIVCMIDGNGRLHPQRGGIACCFGVINDVPTIGVTKSLLCGRVETPNSPATTPAMIRDGDELLGMAMWNRRSRRPIYISVGHRITLQESVDLVAHSMTDHRLPEPTFRADRLSKEGKPPSSP
ncbi:MAG: endonuclease V [Planctomycetaceae bacterium]|nr:endonuclease V [Planctomycetaceae bacterium]